MARVVPDSREDMIAFFADRIASWIASPAAIGLNSQIVTELALQISAAQAAEQAATAARIASKNATVVFHTQADLLREMGGAAVKLVKAYADAQDDPGVLAAASIPPPSTPTPLGPPATPTDVSATLTTGGGVSLTWKSSRAGGTSFTISRALVNVQGVLGAWTLIGTSEESRFIDTSVPVGNAGAQYRIVAQRSGGASQPSDPGVVFFGTPSQQGGSGGLTLAA